MSNTHQELTSPEQTAPALASPEQTATAMASPKQTAIGKDSSNPFMAGSLPKTTLCVNLSAEILTDDNGDVKIHATVDGHSLSITEDKLTFQKGAFSPQWRFLIHNILHCLCPKKTAWEQFSSNIAAAVICLATNRRFNFSRMIFDHMADLLKTKKTYSSAYTKLILRVKSKSPKKRLEVTPTESSMTRGQWESSDELILRARKRRSLKKIKQDKEKKAILIEDEPKKKSKKDLEQEQSKLI
ncbi:hypothetical protein Tco_1326354 [Tanacetum coccineum]